MIKKVITLFVLVTCLLSCTKDSELPLDEQGEVESSTEAIAPEGEDASGALQATFRLASWNIRIFSNNSRDDTELRQISQILIEYDFVAILELRDEAVLQRTLVMLAGMGRDYDYQISEPVGRGVKERYAYLYDAALVEVVEAGQIYDDPQDLFIREPYYATFRASQFDFTIIAIHVIWGDTVAQRRAEILQLDDVYRAVQDRDPLEQDILLVGDFNREPDDTESYADLTEIDSMIALFNLPQRSHIKDTSLYDNIWMQTHYVTEYTGTSGIDRFDEIAFNNNDELANLAVSDHRPVWAEFRIDMDDDHPSGTSGVTVVVGDPDQPVATAGGKININTATKAELMTLDGIGEVLADRIIAGRPYERVEDLLRISGIGSKTLAKIRDKVTVSATECARSALPSQATLAIDRYGGRYGRQSPLRSYLPSLRLRSLCPLRSADGVGGRGIESQLVKCAGFFPPPAGSERLW
ncbi:helix-hairpin-helix domain-containing protein [Candidatus Poribacteria bacterium]|nr:helix-hairpin-helix domain-containing protein [Candidatus Poribacteria bacterium]